MTGKHVNYKLDFSVWFRSLTPVLVIFWIWCLNAHRLTWIFISIWTWQIFISWFLIAIYYLRLRCTYFLTQIAIVREFLFKCQHPIAVRLIQLISIHVRREPHQILNMSSPLAGARLSLPLRRTKERWVRICSHEWWDRFDIVESNDYYSWYTTNTLRWPLPPPPSRYALLNTPWRPLVGGYVGGRCGSFAMALPSPAPPSSSNHTVNT